jgi:hypothetical protein
MEKKIEFTEEQIQELIKSSNDPIYFIENYIKILHPRLGEIPFKLYDYQKELIVLYRNNKFNISAIARQSGKSELVLAYIIWMMIFKADITVGLISSTLAMAKELKKRAIRMIESLPDWWRMSITTMDRNSIELDTGSRLITQAASINSFKGCTLTLLYLDDFAYVPHKVQTELFASLFPVLSTGGSCIISSTVGKEKNLFYDLYKGSLEGTNRFIASKYTWKDIPGRDEKFKEEMIRLIGLTQWMQDYECEWVEEDVS